MRELVLIRQQLARLTHLMSEAVQPRDAARYSMYRANHFEQPAFRPFTRLPQQRHQQGGLGYANPSSPTYSPPQYSSRPQTPQLHKLVPTGPRAESRGSSPQPGNSGTSKFHQQRNRSIGNFQRKTFPHSQNAFENKNKGTRINSVVNPNQTHSINCDDGNLLSCNVITLSGTAQAATQTENSGLKRVFKRRWSDSSDEAPPRRRQQRSPVLKRQHADVDEVIVLSSPDSHEKKETGMPLQIPPILPNSIILSLGAVTRASP